MSWLKGLKGKVKVNEPLSKYTTFKIGGPAKFLVEPLNLEDLKALLDLRKRYKFRFFILGAGSNLLVADKGLKAVVMHLGAPFFRKVRQEGDILEAGSGIMLNTLMRISQKKGLSGLEFLSGIPGTLGGALAMNAACWGKSIADFVEKVKVMDYNGSVKYLDRDQIRFGYRSSSLQRYIILAARLKFTKAPLEKIARVKQRCLRRRSLTQDNSWPNAGCIFKNPSGQVAGRLIELCGLKGKSSGGALVSLRHANFILNRKNASSSDVLKLISIIKRTVKSNFNVSLQPEIRIWR